MLIRVSALYYAQAYHFVWRYAGIGELVKLLRAAGRRDAASWSSAGPTASPASSRTTRPSSAPA
ncbi:MAG: hypothetical protein AB1505_35535, partial [Candidatus Latescibacterota bacterium]